MLFTETFQPLYMRTYPNDNFFPKPPELYPEAFHPAILRVIQKNYSSSFVIIFHFRKFTIYFDDHYFIQGGSKTEGLPSVVNLQSAIQLP